MVDLTSSTTIAVRTPADLPGPRALPLPGNLHQFDRMQFHRTIEQWACEYGP